MGIEDLVVAGSHGFDIWSPQEGTIADNPAAGFEGLIAKVTERLQAEVGAIRGVTVEPKRASVAVHYRLAAAEDRERVAAVVQALLAEYSEGLKVTPGKKVYELEPKIDWTGSWWRWKATRTMCRTEPPRRASTSVSCPRPWTSCNEPSSAAASATTSCASTRGWSTGSTASRSRCGSAGPRCG